MRHTVNANETLRLRGTYLSNQRQPPLVQGMVLTKESPPGSDRWRRDVRFAGPVLQRQRRRPGLPWGSIIISFFAPRRCVCFDADGSDGTSQTPAGPSCKAQAQAQAQAQWAGLGRPCVQ